MHLFEETLFLLLAFLDLEFTKRKIAEYGIEVELNPLIRKLVSWLGIDWGTSIGILVPTGVIAILGWYLPELLAFVLGVRTFLFLLQLRSRES